MPKYSIENNTGGHRKPYKQVTYRWIKMEHMGGEYDKLKETTYGCDACGAVALETRKRLAQVRCIPMDVQ